MVYVGVDVYGRWRWMMRFGMNDERDGLERRNLEKQKKGGSNPTLDKIFKIMYKQHSLSPYCHVKKIVTQLDIEDNIYFKVY